MVDLSNTGFLNRAALLLSLVVFAGASSPTAAQTPALPRSALTVGSLPAVALTGLPGYRHSEISPQACRLINAGRRDCLIPGATAGRYLIRAAGTSMAIGARPRQQLTIIINGRNCVQKIDVTSWSGPPRTIRATCEVAILSDTPLLVSIVYADLQALKEARGPEVSFERIAWTGVLEMRDASAQ